MGEILGALTQALPILPTILVILVAAVATRLTRHFLRGGPEAATRGDFRLQLVNLTISILGAIAVVVVLPINPELRAQLLSVFGIVLSAAIALASTTFVGNIMAGVMLKAVRNFRTGDFVQVGEQFGRVTERGLLSTEIQTEDRDLVTLPNLHLVTNPVKVLRSSGTIVSAEVSLGYDVHHERVEQLLLAAAADAGLGEAFVLVMDLGDFSVTYRVAGLLENVKHLLTVRSRLRVAMLDHLHAGGVEIVSPNFMNQRQLQADASVVPVHVQARAATESATVEEIAFDKAEEAASLDQLVEAYKKTQEEIAGLAEPPAGADPEQVKKHGERLARRLSRLEVAITARREADDGA